MVPITILSDSGDVFDFARPILQPIYEALEIAVPKAQAIIVENGWPRTATLFCHLVRAEMKTILQGRSCPIEFDEVSRTVDMHTLGNEGLATSYEGITLRIWRGTTLPKALTQSKKIFYQHSFPESFWTTTSVIPIQSLVVLWSCCEDGNNLSVSLCCPGGTEGKYLWIREIEHPSQWMKFLPSSELRPGVEDDFDDLLLDEESLEKGNK